MIVKKIRGKFFYQMDGKGRVNIPKKLRKKIEDRIFIVKNSDGCLSLCQNRKKGAIEINMDKYGRKYGRIRIPQSLRVYAGLEKKIVFAGCGKTIEIWSPENWAKEKKRWKSLEKRWVKELLLFTIIT